MPITPRSSWSPIGGRLPHVVEQRPPVLDALVLLCVVRRRCVRPPVRTRPVSGVDAAGEQLQQGRLARAVEAHDHQALAAADVEGDLREDLDRAVGLRQPASPRAPDDRHSRRFGEPDGDGAALLRAVDLLAPRCRSARASRFFATLRPLRRLTTHRVRPLRQTGDLLLLAVDQLADALLLDLTRGEVLRVGPAVLDDHADGVLGLAVEVDDPGDRVVEQTRGRG